MRNRNDYHILEALAKKIGPSGYEYEVQSYFSEIMKQAGCKNIHKDSVGNCYAEMKGDSKLPKLMITAHADSVGFMIKHIDDRGLIFTTRIGPWENMDYRTLPTNDVVFVNRRNGRKIHGHFNVIRPIHSMDDNELTEPMEQEEIPLDIGARSLEQVRSYLNIGDYGVLEASCRYSDVGTHREGRKTGHFTATNLDDRAGLFCLYKIAKEIKRSKLKKKCPITFVSTVTEESSTGAAKVAAANVQPDISLTIDGTVATDAIRDNNEDTIGKKYGTIGFEKGVVLPRSPGVYDPVFMELERICRGRRKIGAKIPYQVEVNGGGTENADIQIAGKGVKTAAILIPMRNLHTRVETIHLKDLEATIDLSTDFIRRVSRGKFR